MPTEEGMRFDDVALLALHALQRDIKNAAAEIAQKKLDRFELQGV
jgi:hypothetical protein